MWKQLKYKVISAQNYNFETLALEIFQFQAKNCELYSEFLQLNHIEPKQINSLSKIPFLPIQFFKNHSIKSIDLPTLKTFQSSGTTANTTSKHHIVDLELYKTVAQQIFEAKYGALKNYCVLALLPSYLERNNSSLVYMVEHFVEQSNSPKSGFYLNEYEALIQQLKINQEQNIQTLLIGVSFALIELAEQYNVDLSNIIIMETGGMKGRRKEITRTELHKILIDSFHCKNIHSEYGMTELLAQSYSKGKEIFEVNPWFNLIIRDLQDPYETLQNNKAGAVNIIDLANLGSCSFLATDDLGIKINDTKFKIIGRIDNSDRRGCNTMI